MPDSVTAIKQYVDTAEQLAQTPEENAALSLELVDLIEHLGKVQFKVWRKATKKQQQSEPAAPVLHGR